MRDDEVVLVHHEPLHHVVFDDGVLRVINAILEPGDMTLVHTHERANVAITIEPGRLWSRDHQPGAQRFEYDTHVGRVAFKRGPYTHRVGNASDTRVRIMHFELLAPAKVPTASPMSERSPAVIPEVENEAIRIYRVRLAPGTRTEAHRRSAPVVVVAIDTTLEVEGRRVSPGGFSWRPDGVVPEIEIEGATGGELIEMEWLVS